MMLHVILLVVVGLFALAGSWQLDRLSDRRERNALVRERRSMPVAEIGEFVDENDKAAHRRIKATGRYDTGRELILLGRGDDGRPGNHVLTPLVVAGGRALIVDRGWVPSAVESARVADTLPPDGRVEVTGVALPSEGRAPLSGNGEIGEAISRIDVARIGRALPDRAFPFYLVLQEQQPSQAGDLPKPASLPGLDEGSHLIYAIQWFCFIPIALVGYGAILRREARKTKAATSA